MSKVKRFSKNTEGSDYVVGDIHGCFAKLETELYAIGFNESEDRLFCVGDMVDRGPDSELFMDWLDKPWFHSVRGNHEELLWGSLVQEQNLFLCHMANGGNWCLDYIGTEWGEKAISYINNLPYIIEVETYNGLIGILHADTGLCYDWEKFKQGVAQDILNYRDNCLWGRDHIDTKSCSVVEGVSTLYVGHSPVNSLTQHGNIVYIDTGACFKSGGFTIVSL